VKVGLLRGWSEKGTYQGCHRLRGGATGEAGDSGAGATGEAGVSGSVATGEAGDSGGRATGNAGGRAGCEPATGTGICTGLGPHSCSWNAAECLNLVANMASSRCRMPLTSSKSGTGIGDGCGLAAGKGGW